MLKNISDPTGAEAEGVGTRGCADDELAKDCLGEPVLGRGVKAGDAAAAPSKGASNKDMTLSEVTEEGTKPTSSSSSPKSPESAAECSKDASLLGNKVEVSDMSSSLNDMESKARCISN